MESRFSHKVVGSLLNFYRGYLAVGSFSFPETPQYNSHLNMIVVSISLISILQYKTVFLLIASQREVCMLLCRMPLPSDVDRSIEVMIEL
jgi:hypothetical protein